MSHNDTELHTVDLFRAIASILVVTVHVYPFGATDDPLFWSLNYTIRQGIARLAVPYFFIVSGYFLYRKTSYEAFDPAPTRRFVRKYLFLYAVWTLIYLPRDIPNIFWNSRGLFYGILIFMRDIIIVGGNYHLWYLHALIVASSLVSYLCHKKISLKAILAVAASFYALGLLDQSWSGLIVPLREGAPAVWQLLKLAESIMVTTRNGLFEGFLFVAMGAWFAFRPIKLTKKQMIAGLVVSYSLLLCEVTFVETHHLIRELDTYIFLVPTAGLLFLASLKFELPGRSETFYRLRKFSSLLYFDHIWVRWCVLNGFTYCGIAIGRTPYFFLLTLLGSVVLTLLLMRLSRTDNMRWLNSLY